MKHIPGEPMQPNRADWLAGRNNFQAQQALNAKAVRGFLIKNPGSTRQEMESAGLKSLGMSLTWLQKRRLVKFVKKPDEPARWYHLEMEPA